MRIAVLGGGYSAEREVSLRSANNVYEELKHAGFDAGFLDLTAEPDDNFINSLKQYDLVMPILHGRGGEDGTIQLLLEKAGIKFLGSSSSASKNASNKEAAKNIFSEHGIKVPKGKIISKSNVEEYIKENKEFVLKPVDEGSSVGTIIARHGIFERKKIEDLLEIYGSMLGEELISGVEITVPVLSDKALPPVAIFPPENEEFDLDNKYNGKTREICPIPETVLPNYVIEKSKELAELAHKSIGARHLSRVDMIVKPDNEIVVLEINTMPGMTTASLFPKSAKVAGISFENLVSLFVNMVVS